MDHKRLLTRFIDEVWNSGNFDNLSELVHLPYTVLNDPQDPWNKQDLNKDAFIYRIMYSRNAFPDLHVTVHEMIQEANCVCVRWTMDGTHTADLPVLKASGKTFSSDGITMYYVQRTKIQGHRQVYDQLGFLKQVGAIATW